MQEPPSPSARLKREARRDDDPARRASAHGGPASRGARHAALARHAPSSSGCSGSAHEKRAGRVRVAARTSRCPATSAGPGPASSGVASRTRYTRQCLLANTALQKRQAAADQRPLLGARRIERDVRAARRRRRPAGAASARRSRRQPRREQHAVVARLPAASPSRAPARRVGASSAASQCERVNGTSTRTGAAAWLGQEALERRVVGGLRRRRSGHRRRLAHRAPHDPAVLRQTPPRPPPTGIRACARAPRPCPQPRGAAAAPQAPAPPRPLPRRARASCAAGQRAQQQRPGQQHPVALDVAAHRRVDDQAASTHATRYTTAPEPQQPARARQRPQEREHARARWPRTTSPDRAHSRLRKQRAAAARARARPAGERHERARGARSHSACVSPASASSTPATGLAAAHIAASTAASSRRPRVERERTSQRERDAERERQAPDPHVADGGHGEQHAPARTRSARRTRAARAARTAPTEASTAQTASSAHPEQRGQRREQQAVAGQVWPAYQCSSNTANPTCSNSPTR